MVYKTLAYFCLFEFVKFSQPIIFKTFSRIAIKVLSCEKKDIYLSTDKILLKRVDATTYEHQVAFAFIKRSWLLPKFTHENTNNKMQEGNVERQQREFC